MTALTRRQQAILDFLCDNAETFTVPPTLDQLCMELGLASRGSMHKHIRALIEAGWVEPFAGQKQTGIRLTAKARNRANDDHTIPFVGRIAAGRPIEALETVEQIPVPGMLKTDKPCYVLQVQGDSMIEAGIYDGDWVVIEQCNHASNGQIVVALIDKTEATLKTIQQAPDKILLIPANSRMEAMEYIPERVEIQGVLVGQMRRYAQ